MNAVDAGFEIAEHAARTLTGSAVEHIERVGGGLNSSVYRLESSGRIYALKQYPAREGDPRERLATEVAALELMERHGVDAVPRVIAYDHELGCALLEWIEGTAVDDIGQSDVDQAVAFLTAIHGLRRTRDAAKCGRDVEACLSAAEIERQIRRRLAGLRDNATGENELHAFLDHDFCPVLEKFTAEAREQMTSALTDYDSELPPDRRSLVASDFGFHNALRKIDGSLVFLDFEYFGWDDPAKLIADTLQHPGSTLPNWAAQKICSSAERVFSDIPGYRDRFDALYPLFGLRWCLIVLNDFLPDRWHRRPKSRANSSWSDVKARQLNKARMIIECCVHSDTGMIDGNQS
jgi:fructosamine-3-kinase